MSVELFVPFIAKQLDCAPQEVVPERGSPMQMAELLWPLAQLFSGDGPDAVAIREAIYDSSFEPEVDAFLESWEADPYAESGVKTAGAARVLYERVTQALIVCGANEAAGQTMLLPPRSLPIGIQQIAAALLMLHRMDLPFEPGAVVAR
jgi:hypothetical protein